MSLEIRTIQPEELVDFRTERKNGARYFVRAKIAHPPIFSGLITAPLIEDETPLHYSVPVFAIKKNYLRKVKFGEEGALIDAAYEDGIVKFLKVNWRRAVQIYYANPSSIPDGGFSRQVQLEDMFEIVKVKNK